MANWTIDELENAIALAELEGWGQQKRLVARLCAEVHNAVSNAVFATSGNKEAKPPTPLTERLFLPRRVKAKIKIVKSKERINELVESQLQKTSRILNALAGF